MKLGRVTWIAIQTAAVLVPVAALANYIWWKSADQALLNIGGWVAVLSMHFLDRFGVKRRLLGTAEPADE